MVFKRIDISESEAYFYKIEEEKITSIRLSQKSCSCDVLELETPMTEDSNEDEWNLAVDEYKNFVTGSKPPHIPPPRR